MPDDRLTLEYLNQVLVPAIPGFVEILAAVTWTTPDAIRKRVEAGDLRLEEVFVDLTRAASQSISWEEYRSVLLGVNRVRPKSPQNYRK